MGKNSRMYCTCWLVTHPLCHSIIAIVPVPFGRINMNSASMHSSTNMVGAMLCLSCGRHCSVVCNVFMV